MCLGGRKKTECEERKGEMWVWGLWTSCSERSLVDGGRGGRAVRINVLFHFNVREIRYQRHIFTRTEKQEDLNEGNKRSGSWITCYQRYRTQQTLGLMSGVFVRGEFEFQRRAPETGGEKPPADCLFGKVLRICNGLMPRNCGLLLDGTGAAIYTLSLRRHKVCFSFYLLIKIF